MHRSGEYPTYAFGEFRLDVGGRRLLDERGRPLDAPSRVLDTLLCLVEHRGRLVSKETLMRAVWPDIVVEENNLNQAITSLRKLLGDTRADHRYVVTEPGRGYRFVAEVATISPTGPSSVPPVQSERPPSRRRALAWSLLPVVGLALVVAYLLSEQEVSKTTPASATELDAREAAIIPHSVAVLPFENLSPDPDDAYFAAGIHSEIINQLAGIQNLSVIARTSVMQYAGTNRPITEIARELRVESVMEGTVRYAEDKVRITAQLIDGETGTEMWSGAFSRDIRDIFAIQGEIAGSISLALEAEMLPTERTRLERPPTNSSAAYALFLEALKMLNETRVLESVALLDRAVEIDPDFALAYALRGYEGTRQIVNANLAMFNDPEAIRQYENRAMADTDRALARDPDLAIAWVAKATLYQLTWRWSDAAQAFAKAYSLSPKDVNVLREYALFKAFVGEADEALQIAELQLQLNPQDIASYLGAAGAAVYSRNPDRALIGFERANSLGPGNPLTIAALGYTLLQLGELAAGKHQLDTAAQLINEDTGQHLPALTYAYGLYGYPDDARQTFRRWQTWTSKYRSGDGDWALAYLGLRDADAAFEWLGHSVEHAENHDADAGFWALMLIVKNMHDDPILEEPRFRDLRERLRVLMQTT